MRELATAQQIELAGLEGPGHVSYPLVDGIEYLVGVLDGTAVACGALQPLGPAIGELKRMYVRPAYRGRGLSRVMLAGLEELAVRRGFRTVRLQPGTFLDPALALYSGGGYTELPLFGPYVGSTTSVCFEKRLQPACG